MTVNVRAWEYDNIAVSPGPCNRLSFDIEGGGV